MNHHTTHGEHCICHSCAPNFTSPVERFVLPAQTHAGVPVHVFKQDAAAVKPSSSRRYA